MTSAPGLGAAGATESEIFSATGALQSWYVVNADGSASQTVYAGTYAAAGGVDPIQSYATWNAARAITLYEGFSSPGSQTNNIARPARSSDCSPIK